MKVRRTIPPAAAPVSFGDIARGLAGLLGRGAAARLERELREEFGAEHVFLVSSGRASLALILSGLHSLSGRRKVVVPAYTCYSVPSAVVRAGLEVVPCDVDPDTLDFDPGRLERLLGPDTLCVVPTHLFGVPADVSRVRAAAAGKGIYVVEDAAQSMGVRMGGKPSGTLGDVGFFSLGRGKNVTCGSGGIILTSDDAIARSIAARWAGLEREPAVRLLKDIAEVALMAVFLDPRLYWFPSGLPFLGLGETRYAPDFPIRRMSGFRAGLMRSWRSRLERSNRRRAEAAARYAAELGLRNGRAVHSGGGPLLRFPVCGEGPAFKERVCLRYAHLGISPMYPGPIDRIGGLPTAPGEGPFPGAEAVAASLVTLPTHELLTENDISNVCAALRAEGMAPGAPPPARAAESAGGGERNGCRTGS